MGTFLYNLIINPLIQIIEFTYMLCDKIFNNPGLSVIGVSIAVSLLCLPLYIVAERWQQVQRDLEKKLDPGIQRIKAVFKKDEQYMILNAFYKENHYHPLMALRSSFGLLIQIPFFMAAYDFLSHLSALNEQMFAIPFPFLGKLVITADMAHPDNFAHLGPIPINILPIAMTVINLIAGAIYTKGFKWKDKISIYGMALLFLVILYDSPSGLVLYWTMNNIFSLVKNIFYKIKKPLRVLYIIMAVCIAALDVYMIFVHDGQPHKKLILVIACTSLLLAPLAVRFVNYLVKTILKPLVDDKKARFTLFAVSSVSLCLLSGFVIPSFVINSNNDAVKQFCGIDGYGSPLYFLINSTMQMAGLFIFWPMCIYFLFHARIQTIMAIFMPLLLIGSLVNVYIFQGSYGNISRLLVFDDAPLQPGKLTAILNVFTMLIACVIPFIFCKFKLTKIMNWIFSIVSIWLFIVILFQSKDINEGWSEFQKDGVIQAKSIDPVYHLAPVSSGKKNVVVFMLDRAENAYVKPIFDLSKNVYNEDFYKQFEGFKFFRNTISFNAWTLMGSPGLYGGYEFTPYQSNKRDKLPLKERHNQALLTMPRMFTEQADFKATVSDLSWANFNWIPDMSICDKYQKTGIDGINVERLYTSLWIDRNKDKVIENITSDTLKRNFVWYSLFRSSPLLMRDSIYKDGTWWSSNTNTADTIEFLDFYSALDYLPELTSFDAEENQFITIVNETPHSNTVLQAPEFEPAQTVDNSSGPEELQWKGFTSNYATYKRLTEWISKLKENDCYDNTRIILVSDHGMGSTQGKELGSPDFPDFPDWPKDEIDYNPNCLHPILFIKDFNAHGEIQIDSDTFMTNADVPSLAVYGITGKPEYQLIEKPVNPFTSTELKLVSPEEKTAVGVTKAHNWRPGGNGTYTYTLDDEDYFTISKNIFDSANWQKGIKE